MGQSRQSRAKDAQGYERGGRNCGNCECYTEDRETVRSLLCKWEKVSNKRCGLGGFATTKTAYCLQWRPKSA